MMVHRGREDTVRCIVAGLTDDSPSELQEELTHHTEDANLANNGETDLDWNPAPAHLEIRPSHKVHPRTYLSPHQHDWLTIAQGKT